MASRTIAACETGGAKELVRTKSKIPSILVTALYTTPMPYDIQLKLTNYITIEMSVYLCSLHSQMCRQSFFTLTGSFINFSFIQPVSFDIFKEMKNKNHGKLNHYRLQNRGSKGIG